MLLIWYLKVLLYNTPSNKIKIQNLRFIHFVIFVFECKILVDFSKNAKMSMKKNPQGMGSV